MPDYFLCSLILLSSGLLWLENTTEYVIKNCTETDYWKLLFSLQFLQSKFITSLSSSDSWLNRLHQLTRKFAAEVNSMRMPRYFRFQIQLCCFEECSPFEIATIQLDCDGKDFMNDKLQWKLSVYLTNIHQIKPCTSSPSYYFPNATIPHRQQIPRKATIS